MDIAFVFDIDGVLMRDKAPVPRAKEALERLDNTTRGRVPRIYLSNGGGRTEQTRATQLTTVLNVQVSAEECILPHTPMKAITQQYRENPLPVLIIGRAGGPEVSRTIGLTNFVTLEDFARSRPFLFPQKTYSEVLETPVAPDGVSAIFFIEEPFDWGEALQVVVDILRCRNGKVPMNAEEKIDWQIPDGPGVKQSVPIYVANPDFVYGGRFSFVRFTVGAFLMCLNKLHKELVGREIEYELYGKPEQVTYDWAKDVLQKQLGPDGAKALKRIYAIGDNPLSGNYYCYYFIFKTTTTKYFCSLSFSYLNFDALFNNNIFYINNPN